MRLTSSQLLSIQFAQIALGDVVGSNPPLSWFHAEITNLVAPLDGHRVKVALRANPDHIYDLQVLAFDSQSTLWAEVQVSLNGQVLGHRIVEALDDEIVISSFDFQERARNMEWIRGDLENWLSTDHIIAELIELGLDPSPAGILDYYGDGIDVDLGYRYLAETEQWVLEPDSPADWACATSIVLPGPIVTFLTIHKVGAQPETVAAEEERIV